MSDSIQSCIFAMDFIRFFIQAVFQGNESPVDLQAARLGKE